MTDIYEPPPPPSLAPLSLVQRVEALERIVQGIRDMMDKDRQYMADLQERIGL